MSSAFEKLQSAMKTAVNELAIATHTISPQDLGEIYVAFSDVDDGLYISFWGDMEINDGWRISFVELAKKLAESTEGEADEKQLVDGLRGLAEEVAKILGMPDAGGQ